MTDDHQKTNSEIQSIEAELSPGFIVKRPADHSVPFVFCSPHSGRIYPQAMLDASQLDPHSLRKSEDCFVDQLFGGVVDIGAPLIAALFPRAYLDLNREPYELDPELFHGPMPGYANTSSIRVAGGLGTIARVVSESVEIYAGRLPLGVGVERIERLYLPFHKALKQLLDETRNRFGIAIMIDCHSMPSANCGRSPGKRPDFILGDRFGETCDGQLTRIARSILTEMGYDVLLNRPYAGGYITQHYGAPQTGIHTLQIEINRALYMDEETLEPSKKFDRLRADLQELSALLFDDVPQRLLPRAAAE